MFACGNAFHRSTRGIAQVRLTDYKVRVLDSKKRHRRQSARLGRVVRPPPQLDHGRRLRQRHRSQLARAGGCHPAGADAHDRAGRDRRKSCRRLLLGRVAPIGSGLLQGPVMKQAIHPLPDGRGSEGVTEPRPSGSGHDPYFRAAAVRERSRSITSEPRPSGSGHDPYFRAAAVRERSRSILPSRGRGSGHEVLARLLHDAS